MSNNIVITIDGNNMANKDKFYDEVHVKIANNMKGFGRNLDAFNDVLRGGFGAFEYGEEIILKWKNLNKAKANLGNSFVDKIVEIIKGNENVTLMTINGEE